MNQQMKLSEAIMLGSAMFGQAYGTFGNTDDSPGCALGVAAAVLGHKRHAGAGSDIQMFLGRQYPFLGCIVQSPLKDEQMPLYVAIVNLNDEARWSLERIAQFVATFERRFVTASVPASLNKYSVQTKLVYYPVWKDLGLPPYGVEWKEEALPQVA